MELEAFGRTLRLKWHFHNEDHHRNMFQSMSKLNPLNKDAAAELQLSSLDEKLMKVEVPKDKLNIPTNTERKV